MPLDYMKNFDAHPHSNEHSWFTWITP